LFVEVFCCQESEMGTEVGIGYKLRYKPFCLRTRTERITKSVFKKHAPAMSDVTSDFPERARRSSMPNMNIPKVTSVPIFFIAVKSTKTRVIQSTERTLLYLSIKMNRIESQIQVTCTKHQMNLRDGHA
jgi:hypothetical protein